MKSIMISRLCCFKKNMEYNFSIEKDPISLLNDIKKGEI